MITWRIATVLPSRRSSLVIGCNFGAGRAHQQRRIGRLGVFVVGFLSAAASRQQHCRNRSWRRSRRASSNPRASSLDAAVEQAGLRHRFARVEFLVEVQEPQLLGLTDRSPAPRASSRILRQGSATTSTRSCRPRSAARARGCRAADSPHRSAATRPPPAASGGTRSGALAPSPNALSLSPDRCAMRSVRRRISAATRRRRTSRQNCAR